MDTLHGMMVVYALTTRMILMDLLGAGPREAQGTAALEPRICAWAEAHPDQTTHRKREVEVRVWPGS